MLKANQREVFGSSLRPLSFKNQFTELPPGRGSFSFEKNIKKKKNKKCVLVSVTPKKHNKVVKISYKKYWYRLPM